MAEGAVALKAFLQEVPAGRESEFDGLCIHRNDEILRALELVAADRATGRVPCRGLPDLQPDRAAPA